MVKLPSNITTWSLLLLVTSIWASPVSGTNIARTTEELVSSHAILDFPQDDKARRGPKVSRQTEAHVWDSPLVGGIHGDSFSDGWHTSAANMHQRLGYIELAGCEQGSYLTYISFGFKDAAQDHQDTYDTIAHGKYGPKQAQKQVFLRLGQYIKKVELTTHKAKSGATYHTRLGWIRFTLNNDSTLECGIHSFTDYVSTFERADSALLYMSGQAGDAIDALMGHFIPISDY